MQSGSVLLYTVFVTLLSLILAQENIDVVHVVSMNHLDVGFTDFATNVVNKYFDEYFPLAIETSNRLRLEKSPTGYIYTSHPWLVSLYLDCPQEIWRDLHCPNTTAQETLKNAIKQGDFTYHVFPFNSEPEVLDSSLADYAITIAHDLDKQFGFEKKITMSQRDVPGFTRSLLKNLVNAGVKAISIGVNEASAPPGVPKIFKWENKNKQQVIGMVHPNGYGGMRQQDAVSVKGFNEVLVWQFNTDNAGPSVFEDVLKNYDMLKTEFPTAKTIKASTYDEFVNRLLAKKDALETLPVITQEFGDTWLYGVPSDPLKNSQYRALVRYRESCIRAKQCDIYDPRIKAFSRMLIKIAEHTWGSDVKKYLADTTNWNNLEFYKLKDTASNFIRIRDSWIEQRSFINMATESLFDHPLRAHIEEYLSSQQDSIRKLDLSSYTKTSQRSFDNNRFSVRFDSKSGAITSLVDKATSRTWATQTNPMLSFLYRAFDGNDYEKFFSEYFYNLNTTWAPKDFGKDGLKEHGKFARGDYRPTLEQLYHKSEHNFDRYALELKFKNLEHETIGAPAMIIALVDIPTQDGEILIEIQVLNKTATRCPESLFVSFNPSVEDANKWVVDKLGEYVSPLDIAKNGSHHQHGVGVGTHYIAREGEEAQLVVESRDVPVVVFGEPTPFPTPLNQVPDMKKGFHYNIVNNIWGTK
jgi:hypothetical protein